MAEDERDHQGLSAEELEQQKAQDLADRKAMSVITPTATGVIGPDAMPVDPGSGGPGMTPPWNR